MFIARRHLPRRTLLRGLSAAIALPLLDSMIPAQTPLQKTAATPRTRLACLEMVHGAAGSTKEGASKHYWSPEREGRDFAFSYSLEPLAPLRDYITVISNTDAHQADSFGPAQYSADHFRSSSVFLTATRPLPGSKISCGASIDQIYAQRFGQDTPLASLQLGIENAAMADSCGFDFSCVYLDTISWASPTQPLAPVINPRLVFERLFREGRSRAGSVVDATRDDAARLQARLGAADRNRLNQHLAGIRALETRIEAIERRNALAESRERVLAPLGVPDSWEEHVKLMFDLQALAFAADITRVTSFKLSRDTNNRVFPESGVKEPFHTLSHHNEKPSLVAEFAKLNRYHVSVLPYFLNKLQSTPDGDGSLLDHTLVLYGSPMGDSNAHDHVRVPLLLAGHAGGKLRGNLHRVCAPGTPQANALLTVMHALGVGIDHIGDSTGTLDLA